MNQASKKELHKPGNMVPIPIVPGESNADRSTRLQQNWADVQPSLRGAADSPVVTEIITYTEVSREELEEDLVDRATRMLSKYGDVVVIILDVQLDTEEEGILLHAEVEG